MHEFQTIYDGFLSTWGVFGLFVAALLLATVGSVAGLLTRNILSLIGVLALIVGFIYFHDALPLPLSWKEELAILKYRIFG